MIPLFSRAWAGIFLTYIAESCAFPCRAGGARPIAEAACERHETTGQPVENTARAGFASKYENVVGLSIMRFK